MAQTLTYKILKKHLVDRELKPGTEIGVRIDQTLTQDATGTMAYLQFEALGLKKVKTKLSVSYVDHNTLQSGFENADDHLYLQSVASKYGIFFSRPGNGICHQVHLERFAVPGMTLLGSDSHTPTAGGLGMIAMGAGGLDLADASRVAFGTLGFEIPGAMAGKSGGMFEAVFNGDRIRRAIVKTAACDQGPIRAHEISELVERIESSSFQVKPKGILIGNSCRLRAPTEREIWFDMECLDDARKHDICLVPSNELYTAAFHCLSKNGSDAIDGITSSLCRDLLGCDSQFELDRKRYGM